MRKLFAALTAVLAIFTAATVLSARTEAAPAMMQYSLNSLIDQDDGLLQLVAQGCGPGFYRGPYGHCRPMRGGAVVVAPVGPRVAPVCVRRCGPFGCRTVCR